ncbi:MAG: hypothetical protein KME16_22115 [Scytolyngbya sp. HA4215-MV1]|jgi:hypothetical protein|nr:hypothetical protein [Scytolyngbya sp. HA4215-MV1]
MQLDAILILSRFWARELGQQDGYFEAFQIFRQSVNADFFAALSSNLNSKKMIGREFSKRLEFGSFSEQEPITSSLDWEKSNISPSESIN